MKKIGLSCGALLHRYGTRRGLEICKESGFDAVDFDLEAYDLPDDIYGGSADAFEAHFTDIRKQAADLELEISQTHGRCSTYWPDDEPRREWVNAVTEKDLHASALLGSPACVVHFINSTRWGKQPADVMRSKSLEMFRAIIPFAETHRVKIALETFGASRIQGARIREFFADPAEFKWQYDQMDTEYKTMCVDTGHTHEAESFWVPPPEEMIRILGRDISILHLHDNTGHWDDHLVPGMGNINWPAVFDALDEIGYTGVYNFELNPYFAGPLLEEYTHFLGKYLRRFVDSRGSLKYQ